MFYSRKGTFTVESVTSGHPDKVCDQISDAILDACLRDDPMSRVAVETFGSHGHLIIGGEVTTKAKVDYEKIARDLYQSIGYESPLDIKVVIREQSPDIAMGVDMGGAGDQGIMYGFATNETPEYLPIGVVLSHKLAEGLETLRKSGKVKWLKPDGKTQVTFVNGKLRAVLISCQHDAKVSQEEIRKTLVMKLVNPVVKKVTGRLPGKDLEILVNPTGSFVLGGFEADTGLTGRKIMVDTYGGLAPHGGGAFSGKDLTKVDRSAAYMARFVAKNLVANGFAKECLVSVSYAIGKAEPLMISAVDQNGKDLSGLVNGIFDFKPKSIIERLGLRSPIFGQTAAYGHFGKKNLPWEKIISLKKKKTGKRKK
ncbi:MAG: methionine adenosyltransferase [Candidatus Taylorbacteria bacterium RIFCSPLOWO2_02_FULL_43_11]|uniref:Methionine adenosyltransferase n=1 Tax=Candidatus Taylorbacteria bacterium RIFCSPHIGHO2_02_FULL_43_32b TaxID=1802306 RepID=A0A1G2MLH2_9BACT|nr:MAG: methionine adenosyltransferase [Candidatus Taylorbacteria bacterium RIFCSPHIGHO2_01_FULL_43_47]OHA24706.1 MAG: methionine adenosyltransferase [Candidatus Taylorbacteria bacterium RIFCSPHIGHO2_02_FULL_43_32b]OHA31656.1 MAG: methionine adenosyltransferase [Candidatus Taylorbacteria bacterium RIFCSPLOWO2_01_FULL_43_44]OHA35438.1 MAG: methionine adenosyltransferase [Candidatus Taylorbacteria bacterium RIFCSPLOWO2_02_FULL_43_11]